MTGGPLPTRHEWYRVFVNWNGEHGGYYDCTTLEHANDHAQRLLSLAKAGSNAYVEVWRHTHERLERRQGEA